MSTPWQSPEPHPDKDLNGAPPEPPFSPPVSDPYMTPPVNAPYAGVPYNPAGYGAPGAYGPPGPMGAKPDNYLVWAILSTLLCCWPLGIPAIVFASQVDSAWYRGDIQGARSASVKARRWAIISAVTAAVGLVLYLLFWVGLIVLSEADSPSYSNDATF